MAYEMMDDYKRRGFLPPENFDQLPTDAMDVRVMNMQDSNAQEQAGQPAATPAPAAGGSTGGGGMRMMDVPEGANIRRTMTLTGEDGQREQTVASWIHSPTKPAQMEQPGRFERLERQKASMGGSTEARERRFGESNRMRMMDTNRLDRVAKEDSDRLNAQTIEAIKGGADIAGKQATAAGMRSQGAEAAGLTAQGAAAAREQDGFFKGLEYQGRQRDDERSDEQLGLNREQLGMQKEQFQKNKNWDDEMRQRAQADYDEGQKLGQPVEAYFEPQSKQFMFRTRGEINPQTGQLSGFKPLTPNIMAGLTGAPGAAEPTATPGASGAQVGATAPLKRRTQDGRTAMYDPNTKAFIGYE